MMKKHEKEIQWCIDQHTKTNHMYAEYLPYEFHLRMVHKVGEQFQHLLPEAVRHLVLLSLWGHDLIEDTRANYNEVVKHLGSFVADIIYALTNEKGRNRKERADERYYKGIRDTDYADYAKVCDRIANVQYSKMTQSSMFKKYKTENIEFMIGCGYILGEVHPYEEMFVYLIDLFESPMPVK
jgi:(p)ppGpp synthase/HD superfamily hydrolase